MQPLSDRTAGFTDSVIRRMTRISNQYGAVNLSQGFPDFDPPKEILDRLAEVAHEDYHQYSITWGSQAMREALAAKQTFETAFPDIPVYLVYENPYFKVSAGNCVTSEEAIVLLGKIRSQFPEAYLMREDLTVADLIR